MKSGLPAQAAAEPPPTSPAPGRLSDDVAAGKPDGTRSEDIRAAVQKEMECIDDGVRPHEEGDAIVRERPSGLGDKYTASGRGAREAVRWQAPTVSIAKPQNLLSDLRIVLSILLGAAPFGPLFIGIGMSSGVFRPGIGWRPLWEPLASALSCC